MITHAAGRLAASILLAAAMGATASATVTAGEIADKATLSETLLDRGYDEAALAAFDKAAAAFQAASPLQFRTLALAEAVAGYGSYTPRADAVFKDGDTLRIYLEPVGLTFRPDGDGVRAGVDVDVQIRTPGGLILASAEGFSALQWKAGKPLHDVQATLETGLPSLKPGDYLLLLTFRDQGSEKVKEVTLPFSVAETAGTTEQDPAP